LPDDVVAWFEPLSIIALTMVAFLLGGSLVGQTLQARARVILWISIVVVVATVLGVSGGLILIGLDPSLALILGAIAAATDPAAIADVIRQRGGKGPFSETLKGIVAIDDAWGLIVFSFVLAFVGQSSDWSTIVLGMAHELGGAVALGLGVGVPAAFLTGRLSPGEPLQAEAIGIVFLTSGLALLLDASFLVAGMVAGAVIGRLAQHHDRAFHEIEHIQWPFMILFFLLAGASLDLDALWLMGWASGAFLGLRILTRIIGGQIGGMLGGAPITERPWYGLALLPQAGVAVGMALVASEVLPQHATAIMAFTVASTVIFELVGPAMTQFALNRVDTKRPD
jgi:Kef-type K+ transport system membrane component KefB